ncbi:ABC transporter permease [Conexibacter sp. S30A1]|uniref:ABC transporter permease n=1 Tax=Conexibacter sp. S30A1 TaxID=2937800 RepID=UPI00200E9D07|nr:ABC transporter permease [Conexibacter sp. S30A1]
MNVRSTQTTEPQGERGDLGGVTGGEARKTARHELENPRWTMLFRSRAFQAGGVVLLFWVVCAAFGELFVPYGPLVQNFNAINQAPSLAHWFGTDNLGRDVLSRVIAGSRTILIIAPLATGVGVVGGTVLGLAQAYYRGVADMITGRLVEAGLALPTVIVAFLFIVALGPSTATLVIVIGLAFALIVSRTVRTAALAERELDYVAAAGLRGESGPYVMFVEMLPNVLPLIFVEFTIRLGYAIFTVASLSFLGLGVQPPTPDWGADIAASYQYLSAGYWWETLFPALAIVSLVTAINMISSALESTFIG